MFLSNLIKDKPSAPFAFVAGVLPVRKTGDQCSMNMLDEFSMTSGNVLYRNCTEEICGYTAIEVYALCAEQSRNFRAAREWYGGCSTGDTAVYSHLCINRYIRSGMAGPVLVGTESYGFLERLLQDDAYGIRIVVFRLLEGEPVEADPCGFVCGGTVRSRNYALMLLVHLGRLAYDNAT